MHVSMSSFIAPVQRLNVVVLTSTPIGVEMAEGLSPVPEIAELTVVTSNGTPRRRSLVAKVRGILRYDGLSGLARAASARLLHPRRPRGGRPTGALLAERCPGVRHVHVASFWDASARETVRALAPDLGVVAGTYLLPPALFSIPRLGCVNLHLGRAPEFRGSSPGFYEMLGGVPEVGITIHRVTEALDGGNILRQELFPLELAPPGDPVAYLKRFQTEVLVPNGVRLMAATVAALARGEHAEQVQDLARGRVRRRATYALKRELRRRVEARRDSHSMGER